MSNTKPQLSEEMEKCINDWIKAHSSGVKLSDLFATTYLIATALEEQKKEILQIVTMAFGKDHRNYDEFVKALAIFDRKETEI